jgi:acylphosphatase
MNEEARRIVRMYIEGRVQGVGYRAFLAHEAARLGLAGWARNRRDGAVEAVAAGSPAAVEAFIAAARRGPFAARVDALRVVDAGAADLAEVGDGQGFSVAPTV